MARSGPASRRPRATRSTPDLDRFRERLSQDLGESHFYATLLGLDAFTWPELLRATEAGLAYRVFERFQRNTALGFEQLSELINVPRRTMTRRKAQGRFLPDESDRLLRVARLLGQTLALFEGDRDAAMEWLRTPKLALGDAIPLALARTDIGVRAVEHLLGRLEHGVFS